MDLFTYYKTCGEPKVFNRLDLELTIELLRPTTASLALAVRNITMQPAIEKPAGTYLSYETDWFYVDLEQQDVSDIIESLTELNLSLANYEDENANKIVRIRTLIFSWLDLAKTFLHENCTAQMNCQSNSKKPPSIRIH